MTAIHVCQRLTLIQELEASAKRRCQKARAHAWVCTYMCKSAHAALSAQGVLVGFLPSSWSLRKNIVISYSSAGVALFCQSRQRLRLQGHWGERFEGGIWVDFWLRFAFTAMQVSILAEFLCFGAVFDLILFRPQGQGRAFRRCIFGLFLTMPKQHGPK